MNDSGQNSDLSAWNEKQTCLSTKDFAFCARTHIGYVRTSNQDRYVINFLLDGSVLLAVADGLGGHEAGDRAAETIRDRVENIVHIPAGQERQTLLGAARALDKEIRKTGQSAPDLNGIGSTLIMVLVRDQSVWWVHVGDSRLYLFRQSRLIRMTEDQTLARFLTKEGILMPEEIPDHYSRHVMDQYVGCGYCVPESGAFVMAPGDLLVLASDGVYRHIAEKTLSLELDHPSDVKQKCHNIVQAVLNNSGADNLTIMLFHLLSHAG